MRAQVDWLDLIERLSIPWADRHGLSLRWFDRWESVLDDALAHLPQSEQCPHELLRQLMNNPTQAAKRTALITEQDRPVAVLGLRRRKMFWEPVWGGGVCERFQMAALPGYLLPALARTASNIWVFSRDRPASSESLRSLKALPRFGIALTDGYEQHWKTSSHWNTVKSARRRTVGFGFDIDPPGAAEWTITNWARKWSAHEAESDILVAARYYQSVGRYHSFVLRDGGARVAGATYIVIGSELLAQWNFFDNAYRRNGVQTRLDELVFAWASEAGLSTMDLGASYEDDSYKRHWAPNVGQSWLYNIAPLHLHVVRTGLKTVRRAIGRVSVSPRSA
ncbi:MAG TPA: GNAT family N-acetyltransferase [Candidatus Limnocylindria bacterium]